MRRPPARIWSIASPPSVIAACVMRSGPRLPVSPAPAHGTRAHHASANSSRRFEPSGINVNPAMTAFTFYDYYSTLRP